MTQTIFFSWQSDIPPQAGKSFLEEVLHDVVIEIASDVTLDEAQREIEIDSDIQGVPGHPPIVDTIFNKIDSATVFIADLSFTGQTSKGKKNPNPNVLIEYGWALNSLSYERIICVMNIAYGDPDDQNNQLPFDIRHLRWPITFNLPENANPKSKAEQKRKLTKTLVKEIYASFSAIQLVNASSPLRFQEAEAKDGPARFRPKGERIGICWAPTPIPKLIPHANEDVFLSDGSAMLFRLIPSTEQNKTWSLKAFKDCVLREGKLNLEPLYGNAHGYLRDESGAGTYATPLNPSNSNYTTNSIAFAFETGEIWSIDTSLLAFEPNKIYAIEIQKEYIKALNNYSRFLKCLGIPPPYRWIAGLTDVKNRHLQYQANGFGGNGYVCISDNIISEGIYDGEQPPDEALHPFFQLIFDRCGSNYPTK